MLLLLAVYLALFIFAGAFSGGGPVSILALVPALFFVGTTISVANNRKFYFAFFEVNPDGLLYVHDEENKTFFPWNELCEGGLVRIYSETSRSRGSRTYLYLSTKPLSKYEKCRLFNRTTPTLFCMDCREEVLCEIEKYFPISRTIEKYHANEYQKDPFYDE